MKNLIIKPIGGLCNRLLVVDSAIRLRHAVKPMIIWEKNKNLNCAFKDLFHYPDKIKVIETEVFNRFSFRSYFDFYNSFDPSTYRWTLFNKLIGKERRCDLVMYGEDFTKELKNDKNFLSEIGFKNVYISYYNRFGSISNDIYKFQPLVEHQNIIDKLIKQFNEKTIGVHIRRADHKWAIRYSPNDVFIKAMEDCVKKIDANFFLATDSDIVKTIFLKRFGNRIMTRERELNRNSEIGIKDALIDLYCLSYSKEIIGSSRSTFSQVASELGRIKLKCVFTK